jgi:hypothetical protein
MNKKNEVLPATHLQISVNEAQIPEFFQLLQQGIILRREVGCTVMSFLHRQLQLSYEFIEDNIQTVFLDGKPVDNLDKAHVKDGCTLALSSAMPGLVGATMRRGGYYASIRAQISHNSEVDSAAAKAEGFVTLKLFNLVAELLGRTLLQDCVLVRRKNLEDFMSRWSYPGPKDIEAIRDGKPLDWNTFRATGSVDELVLLRLKILSEKPSHV